MGGKRIILKKKKQGAVEMLKKHCSHCKTNYWRQPHEADKVETCGVCLNEGKLADGFIEKKRRAAKK